MRVWISAEVCLSGCGAAAWGVVQPLSLPAGSCVGRFVIDHRDSGKERRIPRDFLADEYFGFDECNYHTRSGYGALGPLGLRNSMGNLENQKKNSMGEGFGRKGLTLFAGRCLSPTVRYYHAQGG